MKRMYMDKKLIKEAIEELWDERAVTYANGAVKFANAITDSWSGAIQAFDGFFLRNFVEDRPEAAKAIIEARLAAAKRARDRLDKHVREIERLQQRIRPSRKRQR
jgi:hypothetical protein